MMMTTMMIAALKGTVILAVAGVMGMLLGRASASLRHLLWTTALGALLALPVLEAMDLRIEVPVPATWLGEANAVPFVVPHVSSDEAPLVTIPSARETAPAWAARDVPVAGASVAPVTTVAPVVERKPHRATSSRVVAPVAPPVATRPPAHTEAPPPPGARPVRTTATLAAASADLGNGTDGSLDLGNGTAASLDLGNGTVVSPDLVGGTVASSVPWAEGLALLWVLGTLALLYTTYAGQRAAQRLVAEGVGPAPRDAVRRMTELRDEIGCRTPVRLVVSDRMSVPATWGFGTATIVLPRSHRKWSAATLDRVLLHELAHVARRDCWTRLMGELTRAFHWPNPMAWLAVARQRLESERACDDRVLARGDKPSAYAEDLVTLARSLGATRLPAAALAMAGRSAVPGRVHAILDPLRTRSHVGRVGTALIAAAAFGLALSLTGLTPVASAQEAVLESIPEPSMAQMASADQRVAPEPEPEPELVYVVEPTDITLRSVAEPFAIPSYEPLWSDEPEPQVAPAAMSEPALRGFPARWPTTQGQELCVFSEEGRRSTSYHTDDDVTRIRWETDDCRVEIDMEGRIDFAADDTGIVAMANGALFEIEERIGRTSRRARFEGEGDGRIERRYWVDGDREDWNGDAERWVAQVLPEIFRHTTINAEARVRRMLADGGPDRVFDEVENIRSDHVSTRYLELLMELGDLSDAEYTRVVDFAAEVDSDHNSAELLLKVVDITGLLPAFQAPMLRAANRLESDHQQTRVLQALLESDLTSDQIDDVLRSARNIESDHNLGQLLTTIAEAGDLSTAGRAAYMEALQDIESDHQYAMVLGAFLDEGRLSDDELSMVLRMTAELESDHQLATVLQNVAEDYPLTGSQVSAYLRAASNIESDHQMAVTATAIIERADFTGEQLALVLSMTDDIDSDHQRAMVLLAVIERRDLSQAELEELLRVADRIGSDHQKGQVLVAIANDVRLDDETMLALLDTASDIGSDHQLAGVLTEIADRYDISGSVYDRYVDLAEGMSRHQRNQVMEAIRRR